MSKCIFLSSIETIKKNFKTDKKGSGLIAKLFEPMSDKKLKKNTQRK